MAYTFDISPLNPLKFYTLSDDLWSLTNAANNLNSFDPNINNRDFDADFFARNIKPWEEARFYAQPFQQGDVVKAQWLGVAAGAGISYTCYLLDCDNAIYATYTPTSPTLTLVGGQQVYEVSIPLYNIPEGYYRVVLRHQNTVSTTKRYFAISEPIDVRELHESSVWVRYTHSQNYQGVFFEYGLEFQARLYANVGELQPESKFNVYEDEPMNATMLSGIPYRVWSVAIGGWGKQVPAWLLDKFERWSLCDSFRLDDKYYTRNEGAKLEISRKPDTVLMTGKMAFRESSNDNSLYNEQYQRPQAVATLIDGAKYLYAHDLTGGGMSTIQVRKIFEGATQLVNYLNQVIAPANSMAGLFSIDDLGRLVYMPASNTELTTYASMTFNDFYQYGLKIEVSSAGGQDFEVVLDVPVGTTEYAVSYDNGATITKGTFTNTTQTLTSTLAAGTHYIYLILDTLPGSYDFNTSTASLKKIDGDCAVNTIGIVTSSLGTIKSIGNLYRYCGSSILNVNHDGNKLTSGQVDKQIKYLYDAGVSTSVFSINLSTQTPSAPPSQQIKDIIVPLLTSGGGTLTTD